MTDISRNTEQLSDHYGEWLAANGFEGDEPADELLMSDQITTVQRLWLEVFCDLYRAAEEREDATQRP
jgi:hypothetical protein